MCACTHDNDLHLIDRFQLSNLCTLEHNEQLLFSNFTQTGRRQRRYIEVLMSIFFSKIKKERRSHVIMEDY